MTISDCCISLKRIKKFGCVGSCGYAPASVKTFLTQLKILYLQGLCSSRWCISCADETHQLKEKKIDISIKAIECDITTVPSGLDKRA